MQDPTSSASSVSKDADSQDQIQVAVGDDTGYAKVTGRGSYKVSGSMKTFAGRLMDMGKTRLVVDLRDCVGMDSTFMGVLAGISQRLRKESGGTVVVAGVSEKIANLMDTLGLSRMVEVTHRSLAEDAGTFTPLETPAESPLESAETMLEAHENLVEIHEDNSLRFQDVLDYLREDIHRHRS